MSSNENYEQRLALKAIVNSSIATMEYTITGRTLEALTELDFLISKATLLKRELKAMPITITPNMVEREDI